MKHYSELLRAKSENNLKKARFHANAILLSDYPASLKAAAQLLLDNSDLSRDHIDNIYIWNMYQLLSTAEASSSFFDPAHWLPWRAIIEERGDVVSEDLRQSVYQEHRVSFLATGKSPIHVWAAIPQTKVKSAIAPYVDPEFYRVNHPDMGGAENDMALDHYSLHGHNEPTRSPNAVFHNSEFLAYYPWTRDLHANPLYLFVRWHEQFPQYVHIVLSRCLAYQRRGVKLELLTSPFARVRTAVDTPSDYQRIRHLVCKHGCSLSAIQPNPDRLNIHIVIPDFTEGGGGHMTIFRMVAYLEQAGHSCTVWIKDYDPCRHPFGPARSVIDFYQTIKANVHPLSAQFAFSSGDALLATSWDTVEIVKAHNGFHDHFYFVQDYEVCFFARGSEALLAEATYQTEIKTICAGPWLDEIMRQKFGRTSMAFYLSFDPDTYYCGKTDSRADRVGARSPECGYLDQDTPVISIAFYARKRTARRAVDLALEGLSLVKQQGFRLNVELFGEAIGEVCLPDNVVGFDNGILTAKELASLYRRCDFGLTFSATNYALVPQEMMACGLPVIELDNESTRAIYPQDVLLFAQPSPQAIATAIEEMANSEEKRNNYRKKALEWVLQTSWRSSFRKVEQFIREEVLQAVSNKIVPSDFEAYYLSQDHQCIRANQIQNPVASIVIPTYNGGSMLCSVVQQVLNQQLDGEFELIIVDSSSTDGSIELLPADSRVSVYKIPKPLFQHGRTRNLGVALARGTFVAFLTQDAIPLNEVWLANIIRPLEEDDSTVAVFGRHVAHDQHPETINDSLADHFNSFRSEPLASKYNNLAAYYSGSPHYRQRLHFYSDNNSCLRKATWLRYPYPDVAYGEDQLWADRIIQLGYTKAYAHEAVVRHSHFHTESQEYERTSVEAYFFRMYFGYDLSQDRFTLERCIEAEAVKLMSGLSGNKSSDCHHLMMLIRSRAEGRQHGVHQACDEIQAARRG